MARQVNAGLGSVFRKTRASSSWRLDNNTGTNDLRHAPRQHDPPAQSSSVNPPAAQITEKIP
jgi:hypothetical protein